MANTSLITSRESRKADSEDPETDRLYTEEATRYTIERLEAAGSPVVTDDEQRRYHNFATYCVYGLPNTGPGIVLKSCSQMVRPLASYGSHAALSITCSTPTVNLDPAMRYAAEPWLIQLQQKELSAARCVVRAAIWLGFGFGCRRSVAGSSVPSLQSASSVCRICAIGNRRTFW